MTYSTFHFVPTSTTEVAKSNLDSIYVVKASTHENFSKAQKVKYISISVRQNSVVDNLVRIFTKSGCKLKVFREFGLHFSVNLISWFLKFEI